MTPVHEEAGDPPVRRFAGPLLVRPLTFDARQLIGRSELAPADTGGAVVHESGVRAAVPDARLLVQPVLLRRPPASHPLRVEGQAPAAAPYAVVPLHQGGEVRPRGRVQRSREVSGHLSPQSAERRRDRVRWSSRALASGSYDGSELSAK